METEPAQKNTDVENAVPTESRSRRVMAHANKYSTAIELAATLVGIIVGVVGVYIATLSQLNQDSQTRFLKDQIQIQKDQIQLQAEQLKNERYTFIANRKTDLAKILADDSENTTLRTYAFREFVSLEERAFSSSKDSLEKSLVQWSNADLTFADPDARKFELKRIALWSCIDQTGNDGALPIIRVLDLRKLDLSHLDLSNLALQCIDLSGANLSNVNLEGSVLNNVILDDVNLSGVNVRNIKLNWVVIDTKQKLFRDQEVGLRNYALPLILGANFAVPCEWFASVSMVRQGAIGVRMPCSKNARGRINPGTVPEIR